jgi:hypothetical protein
MNQEICVPDSDRGVHDIGGLALGPIDRQEHARTLYEMRVDAMQRLLGQPGRAISRPDALRRVIECYTATEYDDLSYYDRWLKAIRIILVEQQVLTDAEIDERVAAIKARGPDGKRTSC